jgi:hypothetical protein
VGTAQVIYVFYKNYLHDYFTLKGQ